MIVIADKKDLERVLTQTPYEFASEIIGLEKGHIQQDLYTIDKDTENTVKSTLEVLLDLMKTENEKYKENGGKTLGEIVAEVIPSTSEG